MSIFQQLTCQIVTFSTPIRRASHFLMLLVFLNLFSCGILGPGNRYYNSTYQNVDIASEGCFDEGFSGTACSANNDLFDSNTVWLYVNEITENDDGGYFTLYDDSHIEIVKDNNGNAKWDEVLYDVPVNKNTGEFILEHNVVNCTCTLKYFRSSFSGPIPCSCTINNDTCYLCYNH